MGGPGSVTVWVARLKDRKGRDEAAARLWGRYFARLVRQARAHLRGRRALADGEDVALAAFDGFVRAAEAGRLPKLNGRDDLWRVLLMMTANKALNAIRDENRKKRPGGRVAHRLAVADSDPGGVPVPAASPDPAEAAALAEGAERLLTALGDGELRRVAVLKLEGHTDAEVAAAVGKSVATVERKLRLIRDIWSGAG